MKQRSLLSFLAFTVFSSAMMVAQSATYGFLRDEDQPKIITALAYPSFSTDQMVLVEGSLFTFLVPEGTLTAPSITPLPFRGAVHNRNGSWVIDRLTPDLYASAGLSARELKGFDVYFAVLQSSPVFELVDAGTPIELFSIALPEACYDGSIEILTNNGSIQSAIYDKLGANANNAMQVSIDGNAPTNIYAGNHRTTAVLKCPDYDDKPTSPTTGIDFGATSLPYALLQNYPNPVLNRTIIPFKLAESGRATMVFSDISGRRILEREVDGIAGMNQLVINRDELRATGVVVYTIVAGDFVSSKQMVVLK